MRRRRRDARPANPGHGTARERAEFHQEQRFVQRLRRCQLASAAVMLVGLTTSTLVCAGEFKATWLVFAGVVVFVAGLAAFAISRPLANWWFGSR